MMDGLKRMRPPGKVAPGKRLAGSNPNPDYTPLAQAAAKALAREMSIVMLAADRLAAGHSLAWPDYERLHSAHQYILTALADLTGREVMQ